jgi:hypothetical protein
VQFGAKSLTGCKLRVLNKEGLFWRSRGFVRWSRKLNAPGSYSLCLIKHYMWGRSMNTMSTRTISPPSLVLLLSLSLGTGPTGTESHPFSSGANYLLLARVFNRKQSENGKWVKRKRKIANNISLESSNRGESIGVINFEN